LPQDVPAGLVEALAKADAIAVLTGSGISAESGGPTFRGAGGLWNGMPPEELATPLAFRRNPELVWEFYDWRRTLLAKCAPNAGHAALVRLEQIAPEFNLITQNVDGLHKAAGSHAVLEIHGNIWRVRCTGSCGEKDDRRAPLPRPLPPHCNCKSLLRPAVVWFGEALPRDIFDEAQRAAAIADVFLVVGTSGAVEPAASLARLARSSGAVVAEINPEGSLISAMARYIMQESAATALPRLIAAVEAAR
jgi:NAD-dependent deacetylase